MDSNDRGSPPFIHEPTLVVGLGRFGLAVLEQLGESWSRAHEANPDPRLGSLRLLHVAGEDDTNKAWRDGEAGPRRLADLIAEGDEPLCAVNFLILRCLGLIRYHRGIYQVALLRDHGVESASETRRAWKDSENRRLRMLEWLDLDVEIGRAITILRLQIAQNSELDLFVTPFIERVRAGRSPLVIADAIVRASQYASGLDPSPWPIEDSLAPRPATEPEDTGQTLDLQGQLRRYGRAEVLKDVSPHLWTQRVFEAGLRAPRDAVDEMVASRESLSSGDSVPLRLRAASNAALLELDDDTFIHGAFDGEYQHIQGEASAHGLILHGLAATLVTAGELSRHVEREDAIVGVLRVSPIRFHEQDRLRDRFRTLQRQRSRMTLEIASWAREIALVRLGVSPSPDPRGEASGAEITGESVGDHPLTSFDSLPRPLQLALTALGLGDPAFDRGGTGDSNNRALDPIKSRFDHLLQEQRVFFGDDHPDVLATIRALIEFCRAVVVLGLEAEACLSRRGDTSDSGARRGAAADKRLQSLREKMEPWATDAHKYANELVRGLEKRSDHFDPELLAARLMLAEVSKQEGHALAAGGKASGKDDPEREQLEAVLRDASEEKLKEAEEERRRGAVSPDAGVGRESTVTFVDIALARSRRLIATHRLARFHERAGNYDEAYRCLEAVAKVDVTRMRPEHLSAIRGHQIVARHALGRIDEARRHFDAALRNLEKAHDLAVSVLSSGRATGDSQGPAHDRLAPEHREIVERHRRVIELQIASVLMEHGRFEEAINHLRGWLKDRGERLGWEQADTLAAAVDLAAALRRRGSADDVAEAAQMMAAVRAGHAPGSIFDPPADLDGGFDTRDLLGIVWGQNSRNAQSRETVEEYEVSSLPPWASPPDSRLRRSSVEEYKVTPLPLWAHGCHDTMPEDGEQARKREEMLGPKLRWLGDQCRRGLLELFWELRNRERPPPPDDLGRMAGEEEVEVAVRQSADLIAEVLYSPFAKEKPPAIDGVRVEAWALERSPGARLRGLRAPLLEARDSALEALDRRLAELGAAGAPPGDPKSRIFTEFLFPLSSRESKERARFELRRRVREAVECLLDTRFLSRTTTRSIGNPPRVNVFVVGDFGEPFVRDSHWTVLQVVHAELPRAFAAVFKDFRGGFSRNLSVVPLFWLPNPAVVAPTEARNADDFVLSVRHEEALIQEKLMQLRREIHRIPNHERFIPTVYVCSRVNDAGVISLPESLAQTHDFLKFRICSAVGRDDWLRIITSGPSGKDFFGTFGCIELEFPVERVREYLAGRLARLVLGELLHGKPSAAAQDLALDLAEDDATATVLREECDGVSATLRRDCEEILQRCLGPLATPPDDPDPDRVIEQYSFAAAREVFAQLQAAWPRLVAPRARMDQQMDALRRLVAELAPNALAAARARADRCMAWVHMGRPLSLPIDRIAVLARTEQERLEECDARRLAAQQRLVEVPVPNPAEAIADAFLAVREAAEHVPRLEPMAVATALALPFALVASGALAFALAHALDVTNGPRLLSVLVTTFLPLLGAVLATLAVRRLLARFRASQIAVMLQRMGEVATVLRGLIVEGPSSIFEFLHVRVSYMGALIERRVVALVAEQARIDETLSLRVRAAAEAAERDLRLQAEGLGVETAPAGPASEPMRDELRGLLSGQDRNRPALVEPADVIRHFEASIGPESSVLSHVRDVVAHAAPRDRWREEVWFAHRPLLLRPGRERFEPLLDEAICGSVDFAPTIRRRLLGAMTHDAPQLGFPGHLLGSEGLDDDGVAIHAHAALVTRPALTSLVHDHRTGIRLREASVRQHTVYLLSLAQGVAPQLPLLHRRHMSYFENRYVPSGDRIHILSGVDEGVKTIAERFITKPSSAEGKR